MGVFCASPAFARRGWPVPLTYLPSTDNSGQDCCAGTRLYVDEKIYDEFMPKLIALAKACAIGDVSTGLSTLCLLDVTLMFSFTIAMGREDFFRTSCKLPACRSQASTRFAPLSSNVALSSVDFGSTA